MITIPTPPQAEVIGSLSFVGRDIDVINQFLSRFRSFSIGYGFLSISYGIVGITLPPIISYYHHSYYYHYHHYSYYYYRYRYIFQWIKLL